MLTASVKNCVLQSARQKDQAAQAQILVLTRQEAATAAAADSARVMAGAHAHDLSVLFVSVHAAIETPAAVQEARRQAAAAEASKELELKVGGLSSCARLAWQHEKAHSQHMLCREQDSKLARLMLRTSDWLSSWPQPGRRLHPLPRSAEFIKAGKHDHHPALQGPRLGMHGTPKPTAVQDGQQGAGED